MSRRPSRSRSCGWTKASAAFALVRWGLIPAWVKDPKAFSLLINARGESVIDKPAFKNAMKRRRCLFPADGFYEWKRDGARKRPYYVAQLDGGADRLRRAVGDLDRAERRGDGDRRDRHHRGQPPAGRGASPHAGDRAAGAFDLWLDCANVDEQMAAALIAPAPDDLLEVYEISPAVNRVANDNAALIEPYDAGAAPTSPRRRSRKRAANGKSDDGQASLF